MFKGDKYYEKIKRAGKGRNLLGKRNRKYP